MSLRHVAFAGVLLGGLLLAVPAALAAGNSPAAPPGAGKPNMGPTSPDFPSSKPNPNPSTGPNYGSSVNVSINPTGTAYAAGWVANTSGQGVSGTAASFGSIVGTQHDLSKNNGNAWKGDSNQICVYCHAPHTSDQKDTAAGGALLWNRKASPSAGHYVPYQSATFDMGTNGVAPQPGPVSLLCLGCHDGMTAVNQFLRSEANGQQGTDDPGGNPTPSGGLWLMGVTDPNTSLYRIARGGTDLTGTHPIGFVYDPSKDNDGNNFPPKMNGIIPAPTSDGYGLPLWGALSGKRADGDRVECATCHEPHNRCGNDLFLRMDNTQQSALCRACHTGK